MKVGIVQFAPAYGQIEKNFIRIQNWIKSIDTDSIIFPELSLSGYLFHSPEEISPYTLSPDSYIIKSINRTAKEFSKTIVYGFAESAPDGIFNSAVIFIPANGMKIYRKTHLFYKEKFVFSPGKTGFFVEYDKKNDCHIGTMICYDWRFPESSAVLGKKGADLIVCPSNLVTDLWHIVMPARAIENKTYLAVANRIGKESLGDDKLFFKGKSAIWDYNGKTLVKAKSTTEEIIIMEIEPKKTRNKSFNAYNDIFEDRRPEIYKI